MTAQGQAVLVTEGQQTEVEAGSTPSMPAPIPPARNELVFTIGKPALGMVTDPSGSSTGYFTDGSSLNQITDSYLSSSEEPDCTIRIREPHTGDYAVVLHGSVDGNSFLTVEGFAEGNSAFMHAASCNFTAAGEMVLQLHIDVLDGLLRGATVVKAGQPEGQPTGVTTISETADNEAALATSSQESQDDNKEITGSGSGDASSQEATSNALDSNYAVSPWIIIPGIVILFAVIFIIAWRKT